MKKYNDKFYEMLHKNSVKRRRMFSVLLVLSLFTTSGVVWMLHGVGITMANEPICEIAEHQHTEDCYEKTLICGLEENEEHTHTDECYSKTLICGIPEHIHTAQCYTDVPLDEIQQDQGDALAIANITADESSQDTQDNDNTDISDKTEPEDTKEEICYEGVSEDAPVLMRGNDVDIMDDEPAAEPTTEPATINTIDNIAHGIKFTLFDYGDYNLEGETNNYDISYDESTSSWVHNNWKATGINSGRNPDEDIMFFAYGTPAYKGEVNNFDSNDPKKYTRDTDGNGNYNPSKNNYSGDYNSDENGHSLSGNRAVQGIVKAVLVNGYPVINNASEPEHSLDYLFSPSTNVGGVDQSQYKTVYQNVNHLLYEQTAANGKTHLAFNSNDHYAYFDQSTNDFTLYANTFEIVNKDHHYATDINPNTGEAYGGDDVNPGFKIGFFPFDQYDTSKTDPNFNTITGTYNHHFGMTMEAKFDNPRPENIGDDPVVFKYSGDDDMWVFVDGRLVLDLGGIHEPAGGMIDFTNGIVWAQDNIYGKTLEELEPDIKANGFLTTFVLNGKQLTIDEVWELIPKPTGINTSSTSTSEENKWIVTKLTDYFTDKVNWEQYTQHEIKMFYLERGGCYSNLALEMNLPTLKPLSVTKDVDYRQHLVEGYEDNYYDFQVYEWNSTLNQWVIPTDLDNNGSFRLKDGERKDFENLNQDRIFKVVEKNYNPNVFSGVKVNGQDAVDDSSGGKTSNVNGAKLMDNNFYSFVNTIAEEPTDIVVKKAWDPPLAQDSTLNNFTVKFKVMRTDSKSKEVKQVALKSTNAQNQVIKTRTFAITSDQWANGYTISGLLARYGDHYYTYSVEELNVPKGYTASYSINGNEHLITNKSTSNVEIHVKKEWENYSSTDRPQVQLTLKRKKIGYEESTPTNLTVNILDEAGSLIMTKTFKKDGPEAERVYAGGDAEISYVLPEGVLLYTADKNYPLKSPTTENNPYMDFDDGILVLRNLSAEDNTISFKVTTDNAYDELLLLHHSFTKGVNGWEVQGDGHAQITSSNNGPYAKKDALLVKNRTAAWNGAKLKLDPTKFLTKHTYTFSAYVKSPYETNFIMTFNDGMEKEDSYHRTPLTHVNANEWTQISATVEIPETVNPYGMFILIETDNRTPIFNVSAQDGKTLDNWEVSGATTISTKSISENTLHAVTAGGITSGTGGIDYKVPNSIEVSAGRTYRLNASVAGVGEANHTINCVVKYTKGSQNVVESIGSVNTSSTTWGDIDTTFTLPSDYVANSLKIGFTADGTEGNTALEVWSYKLTMIEEEIRIDEFTAIEGDTPVTVDANTGVVRVGEVSSSQQHPGECEHTIIATLAYTDTGGTPRYQQLGSVTGEGSTWKNLDSDFKLQYEPDTSKDMIIYYHATGTGANSDFEVWSSHLYSSNDIYNCSTMQNYSSDGWSIFGSTTLSSKQYESNYAVVITNRNEEYEGISRKVNLDYGVQYHLRSTVSGHVDYATVITTLPTKIGYDIVSGQYVSNYSNYGLKLNEASVTTPLKLEGEYTDDAEFNRNSPTIIFPNDSTSIDPNVWTYNWQTADSNALRYISQDNENNLYKYYIEETVIKYDENNQTSITDNMSSDGNFLVTYQNNGVASNTAANPITVTNRYIWYKLPATGGSGTRRIYIAAVLLITISIISGYAIIRRERRYR